MAQSAKLPALKAGAARVGAVKATIGLLQTANVRATQESIMSCGFLDAHTQRPDTSRRSRFAESQLTSLFSTYYEEPQVRSPRSSACTPLVRVCDTIERNEGCSHVSQKTHPERPPSHRSKTLFYTGARGNRALRTCVCFLGCRPALAAAHARLRAASPSRAEGPRPARCAPVRERNRLRRNCFVRRSARSVPSLRVSPRARSGRRFENLFGGRPRRQTRKLQNLSFGRKRSAHRRPAPRPNGVLWADHSLRTRCVDSAGSRFRAAAKPHVRERLQRSNRTEIGNASFFSASSRSCGFSCFQIADGLACRRAKLSRSSATHSSSSAAAGFGHFGRRAFLQSAA